MQRMFTVLLVTSIALVGCDDESSSSSSSSWVSSSRTSRIEELERKVKTVEAEKQRAVEERDKAVAEKNKADLWLGIVLSVIGAIAVVFVGWVGVSLFKKQGPTTSSEILDTCPKCGMKRTSGESVCRRCGTHF